LLLLFSGCPYESKVPLSDPGRIPVDSQLIGGWFEHEDLTTVLIVPFNATEYYIEVSEVGDAEIARLRAFVFEIDGKNFFHYNELSLDGTPTPFSFARYALSEDGHLSLRLIDDKIVPESLQTDSNALLEFIKLHLDDPNLYGSESLFQSITFK
ncbi:MAG: hypothetical protein ACYSWP_22865, partial [Planctomycetota bacterium]